MFKPFRSHRGLLSWVFGCVLEDSYRFYRGFLQRDASMRALWSDRKNCSHNVSQKVKSIKRLSEQGLSVLRSSLKSVTDSGRLVAISHWFRPISRYQSPISRYQSPISRCQSPISRYQSPLGTFGAIPPEFLVLLSSQWPGRDTEKRRNSLTNLRVGIEHTS